MPSVHRSIASIAVLTVSSVAHAQWVDDPAVNTPVVQTTQDQDVIKLAVASDATTWVGWFDFQPGGIEVRVQRLDAGGDATFPAPGLLVSDNPQDTFVVDWDLRADASGNCMLAFVDTRDGGDFDVHAYLIAPDGTFLWGPDGVTVSDNDEFEADPRIIQNSLGDYLVVWPRFDVDPGLYAQRLNAAGAIQLAPGGVRFYSSGAQEPAFAEVIPAPGGDFLCSFVKDTSNFASDRHVMLGRYTADAGDSPAWNGNLLTISSAASVPIAHRPRLLADPTDDAILAWHDTRTGDFDCYLQMVDAFGSIRWAPNGLPVSLEAARQQLDPAVAIDPITSDLMVVYRNTDAAQNIQGLNVQRVARVSGIRVLGSAGAVLTPYDNQYDAPPRVVPCLGGVAALCEIQPNSGIGNFNGLLEVHRIQGDGTLIDGAPINVCTTASMKGRNSLAAAPGGAVIAAWTDDRDAGEDVYAQRVNDDGSLGPPVCVADLAEPSGQLDFSDVIAFLVAFSAMEPAADLAAPEGTFDFSDVLAFLLAFGAGCP